MRHHLLVTLVALLAAVGGSPTAVAETPDRDQFACLALNVYWEARDTAPEVQRSVAHVTLNRVAHTEFPNSICEVVQEGGELGRNRCQFSWWCDGKDDDPEDADAWSQAQDIARTVAEGESDDPTGGALFFHHKSVKPDWADTRQETARNGDHIYYK